MFLFYFTLNLVPYAIISSPTSLLSHISTFYPLYAALLFMSGKIKQLMLLALRTKLWRWPNNTCTIFVKKKILATITLCVFKSN